MPKRRAVHYVKQMVRTALREAAARGDSVWHADFSELEAEWDRFDEGLREANERVRQAQQEVRAVEERCERQLARERMRYAEHCLGLVVERPGLSFDNLMRGYWVYLLRDATGEIIYVGKSYNLLARLGTHAVDEGKRAVASVSLIRCNSLGHMNLTESAIIAKLQPRLNVLGIAGWRPGRVDLPSRPVA